MYRLLTLISLLGPAWGCQPDPIEPNLTPASLAIRYSDNLEPPTTLSPEQQNEEIDLIWYALEKGYGGFAHVPRASLAELRTALHELRNSPPKQATKDLCEALGNAFGLLPDAHLSASLKGEKCGKTAQAFNRKPTVGENFFASKEDGPPWNLDTRVVAHDKSVALLSILDFPTVDDPRWDGFDAAVERILKSDALIVDLRGNGGGDDRRGYQLAEALIGVEPNPGVVRVHERQTPESITLQLNWVRLATVPVSLAGVHVLRS